MGQAEQKLTIKCKEQDRLVIDNVETDVRAITKVRLPRHLSCTLSSQSFTLKTDITQKERLKPIQLEFAVGEVIKQKDVNFKKLISPEVNKLVSKRRKGLSWKEILAAKQRRNERRRTYIIVVLVTSLIATSLLVASIFIKLRSRYRRWKEQQSDDTESVRDLFTKEERRIIEERSEKLKKNKKHDEN